jgi:tight adherence protein B
MGWRGAGLGGPVTRVSRPSGARTREWLDQAGLDGVRPQEFVAVVAGLFLVGGLAGYAVFGGPSTALVCGGFAASAPVLSYRNRRRRRRERAQQAWPGMLEEMRLLTGTLGRSIPQALFEVGRRGPDEMRAAFDAAHREWLISTDFSRTLDLLRAGLADPTADAVCETLLIAHEVGGADLDGRLAALIEDRIQDTSGRKDARAKQAGVRFARRFVLIVPFGMALAGMSVGNGRAAYAAPTGQLIVLAAVALVIACWLWAGQFMKLPDEHRVFSR